MARVKQKQNKSKTKYYSFVYKFHSSHMFPNHIMMKKDEKMHATYLFFRHLLFKISLFKKRKKTYYDRIIIILSDDYSFLKPVYKVTSQL